MRLYLDTNVLVPLILRDRDALDPNTWEFINDTENLLYTSPLCIHEFIFHIQTGRILPGRSWKVGTTLWQRFEELNIELVPVTLAHILTEEQLPIFENSVERHRDPVDRLIVSQAISDKATLVSTDLRLSIYVPHGLHLHQSRHRQGLPKKKR